MSIFGEKSEFAKKTIRFIKESLFFFIFIMLIIQIYYIELYPISTSENHIDSQLKTCFSNQKIIAYSVEMYNIDYEDGIHELNEYTLKELIEKGYSKNIIFGPEKKCYYSSNGDLQNNGFISCKYHGDLNGNINETPYKKDEAKKEYKKN